MGDIKKKDLTEGKLEYGLIQVTSVIEFASFLEPNSDTFHELFCLFSFDKIAVTIPDTRAAFLIWN